MRRSLWILGLLLAVAQVAAAGEFIRAKTAYPGEYIVHLQDDLPSATVAAQLARKHGVKVTHVYHAVLNGFAFMGSERAARAMSRDRRVISVEESTLIRSTGSQSQAIPGNSGLDRIDQRRRPLDHTYVYNETGSGSIIYILDTGVNPVAELNGRIVYSESFVGGDTSDCQNHGTSVATIAAGSVHGVAKQASIVNMKVIACSGDGGSAPPLAAFDRIYGMHGSAVPGVVNMSWFRFDSLAVENSLLQAVLKLVNKGLTVVAVVPDTSTSVPFPCATQPNGSVYEPAHSGSAYEGIIAVSATTLNDSIFGHPDGSYAGSGPCVDILAPGFNLASGSGGGETTFTGVSAAAPIVSGVAALIQQRTPSIATTPGAVESAMKSSASADILGVPNNTRNLLVHSLPKVAITMPIQVDAAQTFNASITPVSGATYQWNVVGGTITAGGSASTVTVRADCQARVTLDVIVDSAAGRSTGLRYATIVPATAYVSGDTYINPGGSATIQAALTGTGPWTVYWSDGFQQTVSSSPATRTVSPADTTTYTAYISTGGCYASGTGSATVTVTDCLPLSGALSVPSSAYSSATVWASATPDEGAYYMWNLTNASTNWLEGPNPYLSFKMGCSGSATVGVQITRSCGMQSTGSASIPIVLGNAVVFGSTTINAGQSATIRADYNGTLPWSIRWSDGVWQTNIGRTWVTRTVTPSSSTTYTAIEVRDPSYCLGTSSGSATITVQ